MANRTTFGGPGPRSFYAKTVEVFAKVTFGAAGAPTLVTAYSRGVLSVTRNAAGKFTFVFGSSVNGAAQLDPYVALGNASVAFNTAGVAGGPLPAAAPVMQIYANNTASGASASLQIGLTNVTTTPALTDPASGEIGHFVFRFIDTTAG